MMTKEQKKERQRIYDAQPHRKAARQKTTAIWRKNNPEAVKAIDARKKAKAKSKEYSLYYLPEDHYVGVTNQISLRLINHKIKGKHILEYEIIGVFKSKKEALRTERYLHSIGYNGSQQNNYNQ